LLGLVLVLVITLTHTGSVVLIAAALWWTQTSRFDEIHVGLARTAGFVIAATGFWRLGRHVAGFPLHEESALSFGRLNARGVIGLGIAGGLVPCWDAVGLLLLADAVGRLALGVTLVVAFGAGMAIVLI